MHIGYAQSLPGLYNEQQRRQEERFRKNKSYCESLYNNAKYEATVDLPDYEEHMRHRYYIKNGRVYAIYKSQPSADGASCNRPAIPVETINRKATRVVKLKDILFQHDVKLPRRRYDQIVSRHEYIIVKEQEGKCLIEYEKDLASGKITRTVLASAIELSIPEAWLKGAPVDWAAC